MGLDVLLQILGALESLAAEVALVRLERDVDANVRCDVIALHGGGAAVAPLARQVQVVGALAANMALADVVLVEGQHVLGHVGAKKRGWQRVARRGERQLGRQRNAGNWQSYRIEVAWEGRVGQAKKSTGQKRTYVELFSGRAALAAALPLADELVAGDALGSRRGRVLLGGRALRLGLGRRGGSGRRHSRLRGGRLVAHVVVVDGQTVWCLGAWRWRRAGGLEGEQVRLLTRPTERRRSKSKGLADPQGRRGYASARG